MLVFIESIIKLFIKLLFVEGLAQESEEQKKEIQRLKQEKQQLIKEKEEIAKAKAEVIENHFSLFQKYLALNQKNEELTKQLHQYKFPDINQEFDPDDLDVIDQLLREFNCAEELTI